MDFFGSFSFLNSFFAFDSLFVVVGSSDMVEKFMGVVSILVSGPVMWRLRSTVIFSAESNGVDASVLAVMFDVSVVSSAGSEVLLLEEYFLLLCFPKDDALLLWLCEYGFCGSSSNPHSSSKKLRF